MSIRDLDLGKPFFNIKYVEGEKEYFVDPLSIVANLSYKKMQNIIIERMPLYPLKGTIVKNVKLLDIDSAVILEDYTKGTDDPSYFDKIRSVWPFVYSRTGLEQHKDLQFYSPSSNVVVKDNMTLTITHAPANTDGNFHKDHPGDILEVHLQVLGYGKMQKFYKNDLNTKYQEFILSPGNIHDIFYDNNFNYPWHRYQSITDVVFMGIKRPLEKIDS